jgi:hypothetical protein
MHRLALASVLVVPLGSLACSSSSSPSHPSGTGGSAGEEETGGSGGSPGGGGSGGRAGTGGRGGSGGELVGGAGGSGGVSSGGSGGTRADGGVDAAPGSSGGRDGGTSLDTSVTTGEAGSMGRFSFFVTSVRAMKRLSNNPMGFGGDLRYGEATGLAGADKICTEIAEASMPGSGAKEWHAFLSTVAGGPDGGPVHAKDRIGEGPWYDRMGRLVAMTKTDLLNPRPRGADPAIINDLPNEDGIPNHTDGAPGCSGNACPDNHDTLTGTGINGMLWRADKMYTCNDWTNAAMTGRPHCGHSWPRSGSGVDWMSALNEGGCAPGINLREQGGPNAPTVGSGGGYGGIYCFAMKP